MICETLSLNCLSLSLSFMAFLEVSIEVHYLQSDLQLTFPLYFKCHTVDNSPDRWFCPGFFNISIFNKLICLCLCLCPYLGHGCFRSPSPTLFLSCDKSVLMKFLSFHTVLLHIILFLMQATLMKGPFISYWNQKRLRISILSALFRNREINANCTHLTGLLNG